MKRINILTLILSTGIVVCSYFHMYYSHKFSRLDGFDQLVIAFCIYFLIQLWFSQKYLVRGLTFVVLAGSTLLLLNFLHNKYADNQLKMHGVKANAIVTSVKYMSGYKRYPRIIIKFAYIARGRIYNHYITDDVEVDRRFGVGDTLNIKYSSVDPDLFEEVGN